MSQEQVRASLGTPATTAVVGNGNAFYYISSTMSQSAFFTPSEKDRQVVAVYFNQGGMVDTRRQLRPERRQGVRLRQPHHARARRQG